MIGTGRLHYRTEDGEWQEIGGVDKATIHGDFIPAGETDDYGCREFTMEGEFTIDEASRCAFEEMILDMQREAELEAIRQVEARAGSPLNSIAWKGGLLP